MSRPILTVNVGQSIIVDGQFGWDLFDVVDVKTVTVKAKQNNGWNRIRTIRKEAIVFAGLADDARKLFERLTSSEALYRDEQNKSVGRKIKRDEELIADALLQSREATHG